MGENLSGHLDDILNRIRAKAPEASFKAMEHLRQVAVDRTPIETGNLRDSAETIPAPMGASVYFPGPYARYQHYELDLKHEEGEALYLLNSVVSESDTVVGILAQELGECFD
ncbi:MULTISPECIES: hypothetical protein [Arthrobacter]|uniref:Uncharacterized protein n=2 Tax=Arthrobacter TaxID=1663 RepID=A0ABU9KIF6_9MICC|nr:hypothetical protein [Arthrobacter sp. YJM1]MDP5226628.1 hypothetical protein [Arthrobacter sp. YJM1]